MANNVGSRILWLLIGMAVMAVAVWVLMPSMMLTVHQSPLGYEATVSALQAGIDERQNWNVAYTYDFQRNIEDAGHGPIERVGSVALCNPLLAAHILDDDANRKVTAFMPLGIGVYEDSDGTVYVSELNVRLLGMMFGGTIAQVMAEAGGDISEVIAGATAE
jgi:uncharacterized protein (DUF302 family)